MAFFFLFQDTERVTSTPPPASSAQKHLTLPPPKAMLLASSSSTALWDSHRLPGRGSLRQEPDDAVVRAQQEVALCGQHCQAGQCTPKVL